MEAEVGSFLPHITLVYCLAFAAPYPCVALHDSTQVSFFHTSTVYVLCMAIPRPRGLVCEKAWGGPSIPQETPSGCPADHIAALLLGVPREVAYLCSHPDRFLLCKLRCHSRRWETATSAWAPGSTTQPRHSHDRHRERPAITPRSAPPRPRPAGSAHAPRRLSRKYRESRAGRGRAVSGGAPGPAPRSRRLRPPAPGPPRPAPRSRRLRHPSRTKWTPAAALVAPLGRTARCLPPLPQRPLRRSLAPRRYRSRGGRGGTLRAAEPLRSGESALLFLSSRRISGRAAPALKLPQSLVLHWSHYLSL